MRRKTKRRRPSPLPLMVLAQGFCTFKTLAVADDLGVFDHVARARGMTSATLAAAPGADGAVIGVKP